MVGHHHKSPLVQLHGGQEEQFANVQLVTGHIPRILHSVHLLLMQEVTNGHVGYEGHDWNLTVIV